MQASQMDMRDEIIRMSGTEPKKCMKCGKCSATCPPSMEMDIRPHRFVKLVEEGNLKELFKSKSLRKCLSCFACVERCPRSVEPASLVEAVRLVEIRKQGNNYLNPDDISNLTQFDEDIPQQLIVSAFRKYSK